MFELEFDDDEPSAFSEEEEEHTPNYRSRTGQYNETVIFLNSLIRVILFSKLITKFLPAPP